MIVEADLLRVTGILKAAGLCDMQWASEDAMDRGTAVHLACQYLDEGGLDFATLDPALMPAVEQYVEFLDHVAPEILAIEEEVRNATLRYAGRLDRRVSINGREGILDIKGIYRADWQAIQLAGYAGCFARPMARWTLHLPSDGTTYRLIEHKDRDDWRVFQAALTVAGWRARHGDD